MSRKDRVIVFLTAAALTAGVMPAVAQENPLWNLPQGGRPPSQSTAAPHAGPWGGYIFLGAGLAPDYDGSRNYDPVPYVEARINYNDFYADVEGNMLRFNVVPDSAIHAGPLLVFRRSRTDVADERIARMADVQTSLAPGGFIEYEHVGGDPRYGGRLTLALSQGVTGSESGLDATLRGDVHRPLDFIDPGFIASLSADLGWGDDKYMRTYYGVGAADASRSRLPQFNAGSGLHSVGIGLAFDQFLSEHWSIGARFHYARLLDDAADSPVTRIAGSPDQFFVGLVTGFAF